MTAEAAQTATPIVRLITYPSVTFPVTVGICSVAPSLKTMSVARLVCARFRTLAL